MSMYKDGSFYLNKGIITIVLCGVKFSIDDMSDATKDYIHNQIKNGVMSGPILEIDSPVDDVEKTELGLRYTDAKFIMKKHLFDPKDEAMLTCELQQLSQLLGFEPDAQKEIHIWLADKYPRDMFITYQEVTSALAQGVFRIDTPIPVFCSSKYADMGYRIFAHMIDGEVVEIHEGLVKNTGREIRHGMNWMHLLLCNEFGYAVDDAPNPNKA